MIRALAIGLGLGMIGIVIGVGEVFGVGIEQSFGAAFWLRSRCCPSGAAIWLRLRPLHACLESVASPQGPGEDGDPEHQGC